jgi:hypothetical protein
VAAVADDQVAQLRELDADLVAAAGPEAELEERRGRAAGHDQ